MQTDGRANMTKLTVAFRNSSNVSKKKETQQEKTQGRRKKERKKKKIGTVYSNKR
jgi:hypothetical protein